MTYQLDMDGETRTLITHMAPVQKRRIKEALRTIAGNPLGGKALQDELEGFYSYRVTGLRIVYSIHPTQKLVQVITIGPRRTIYQELEQLLSRKPRLTHR